MDLPLGNSPDGIYDRVEHRYNRQGRVKESQDQNGTVRVFEYDSLGRMIHDRVTTLGSGVSGTLRRVSTAYEVRSLVENVTSYDNATLGSGTVVSEIVREFNDLGMILKEYQEHGGAKSGSTLYVGINYETSASSGDFTKGLRQTSVRYPNSLRLGKTTMDVAAIRRLVTLSVATSVGIGQTFSIKHCKI